MGSIKVPEAQRVSMTLEQDKREANGQNVEANKPDLAYKNHDLATKNENSKVDDVLAPRSDRVEEEEIEIESSNVHVVRKKFG